jgi:hypothetical protein
MTTKPLAPLEKYFYFFMSLLIATVIVYGFSRTVDKNLIHPPVPRPFLRYVHAAIFSSWVVFFILQSALVRTHNVRLHRTIGWFGVALGVVIPPLGASTAITMARFDLLALRQADAPADLIIPLFDMLVFMFTFALAIYWRKKLEFHRRFILIAFCALTAAAFGRFPANVLPSAIFYSGVDILILLGVVRDLLVNRRIHQVCLYALPAIILGQTIVTYTNIHKLPY